MPWAGPKVRHLFFFILYMANMDSVVAAKKYSIKKKIIFIMGSTGSGKTKLSIDLAQRLPAEIINSDKIQVYKGLDVVTNKATEAERRGVPHHLFGNIDDPDEDFTVEDFCSRAMTAINQITGQGLVPVIVGGSNTYIKALVEDPSLDLRSNYNCCFLWMDVELPVLFDYVSQRVDQMVNQGLVDEAREVYVPGADYSRGVRRAIGVPEMDYYLSVENNTEISGPEKEELLRSAIEETKANTCKLAARQREKIEGLIKDEGWKIHRLEATQVFQKSGKEAEEAWEKFVLGPSLNIVGDFLKEYDYFPEELSVETDYNWGSRVEIPC